MASTSASPDHKSFKYDVFISFRGEDTRKNFVDHLYYALMQKSIHTYKDDVRITKGKRISDELITSIEDSRFYIVVFSKNYASSSWCLDELVQIMEECHKSTFHTAYPVFYDVEPTEIRKQSGSVGEAFSKLEKQDASAKWREALKEAADLAGWELKNTLDGHEAKFIQKIVEEISVELRFIDSSVDGKLIGMESRVKGIVSDMETGFDDVRMIGIKGIGGGGKTTLARAVFDHTSSWFEGRSFVENVREVSKASLTGLKKLQKQVLSDVLNDPEIKVSNVHEGKKMMKKMLSGRKVLVVLDDVDNIEQLEALAGAPNWFKPGSRIIITTRDEQALVAHRVNMIRHVNLLSYEEAVSLFSMYAFGREIPIQGYEELSRNVVSYAAGLPLTLRVLGSFLCGKNEPEWKDAIDRLKMIPLRETLEKLELSYIGLEEDYKEMFLDVACILKWWKKHKAVAVLESCGFHAKNGLKVLEQKSLLTISKNGRLVMHDHIEEMGMNIVRRSHPDKANRHSRLWIDEEIEDILANNLGTKATRCIEMEIPWDYHLETFIKRLGNMKKLRVLVIYGDGNILGEAFGQCLPNALRYLGWDYYPFESLMNSFQEDHLVGLDLPRSEIKQLWKSGERKVLKNLRFLGMNSSNLRTLNLEMIPNIETLNLKGCRHLRELNMPFECPKLKALNLEYCEMLRTLKFAPTPELESLSLEGCDDLLELHIPFRCPKLKDLSLNCYKLRTLEFGPTLDLEMLSIHGCDLFELQMPNECPNLKTLNVKSSKLRTIDLGLTSDLETLSLKECHSLIELNMPFGCPKLKCISFENSALRNLTLGLTPDLETLSLVGCHDLLEFCMPLRCPKVKDMSLNYNKFRTLEFGPTLDLEMLSIHACDLLELYMPNECPNLKTLDVKSSNLRTIDLGGTPNLETLSLRECHSLIELNMPFGCPKLKCISLENSALRNRTLGLTPDLETFSFAGCHDLLELRMPLPCPKLKALILEDCTMLRTLKLAPPDIESFSLERCYDLLELHMPFRCPKLKALSLKCSKLRTVEFGPTLDLETLSIEGCDLLELHMPNECPNLKSLAISSSQMRTLNLGQTSDLETLSLAKLPNLIEVNMPFGCPKLKSLSLSDSKLRTFDLRLTPNLERLDIKDCFDLVELHCPIGSLEKLVYLNLSDCGGFKYIWFDKSIGLLRVGSLHLIAETIDICPLHSHSNMPQFLFSCLYEEPIPSLGLCTCTNLESFLKSICNLQSPRKLILEGSMPEVPKELISVGLCTCTNLESFSESICSLHSVGKLTLEDSIPHVPKDLDRLESIEELTLLSAKIQHLPDSICMMKHLKLLKLESCWLIEKLPDDLGRLECLEELYLTDCIFIRDIPNSVCELKRLKYFHLPFCMLVEKLPEEVGRLECLKELNIEGAGITHLPQSIFGLEGLRIIGSRWRLQSYGFTSMYPLLQNSSYMVYIGTHNLSSLYQEFL